ncbi:Uncharacterised protein [Escherichia coli]|uniref:Uncharacterized protein n=1 Tax=Escherichia coli TaxID=562 RepID=A0A377D2N6_ECOLX|nr:Uncharacterised protein [Escherichia coli]
MTYMKLTAAKRIVFFIYLFVIQFWKTPVFKRKSVKKTAWDMMKVERGNKRPIHKEWAVKGDYATGRAIMLRVSMRDFGNGDVNNGQLLYKPFHL